MFRKLNEQEDALLKKLRKRGKVKNMTGQKKVRYDVSGNFVVAVIRQGPSIYTGVAKFNPADQQFNPEVGQQLAFSRAVMGGHR